MHRVVYLRSRDSPLPMRKSALLLLTFLLLPLAAQSTSYRDPQTPRKNGKPDVTAPAPRMNGKPDLSGVWQAERAPVSEISSVLGSDFTDLQVDINDVGKYYINAFWGLKPDQEPLRPEAGAIMKQRANAPHPHRSMFARPAFPEACSYTRLRSFRRRVRSSCCPSPAIRRVRSIWMDVACRRIPNPRGQVTR